MARRSSLGIELSEAVAFVATVVLVCAATAAVDRAGGEVACVCEQPPGGPRRGLGKGEAKRAVETESFGGSGSVLGGEWFLSRLIVMKGTTERVASRRRDR